MRDTDTSDQLLQRWVAHRRAEIGETSGFERKVMERIQAMEVKDPASEPPPTRLQQVALTSASAAAGITKVFIILHLAT